MIKVRNWKTTLGGVVILIATGLLVCGTITVTEWCMMAGIAGTWLGFTAKDHDVSGGIRR